MSTPSQPGSRRREWLALGILLGGLAAAGIAVLVLFLSAGLILAELARRSDADSPVADNAPENSEPLPEPRRKPWLPSRAVPSVKITPTPLDEDRVVLSLPGKVRDACVGGGGRYWVLRLEKPNQLVVFDVNTGKLLDGEVSLAGNNVRLTAGMTKLVVSDPAVQSTYRIDLTTLRQEISVWSIPQPRTLTMGSASEGPILYQMETGSVGTPPTSLLELKTITGVPAAGRNGEVSVGMSIYCRASPDGRVFVGWGGLTTTSLVLTDRGGEVRTINESIGEVTVTEDGTLLARAGLFSSDLRPLGPRDQDIRWRIAATHGPAYLVFKPKPDTREPHLRLAPLGISGTVRVLGADTDLAALPDALPGIPSWTKFESVLTVDKRFLFCPAAKLIACIHPSDDRLVLLRFDLDAELAKSGKPYLFVSSRPGAAERGTTFTYTPTIKSSAGGAKLKLDAGPDGMTVAGDKLVWAVPNDFPGNEVSVVLSVSDAGGREVFHTFTLSVLDPAGQ